jgi:hypothetical protein
MLETYLKLLDLDFFELGEAFKGLKDENVWRRPAEGLLSVGEIAGHITYWHCLRLAGDGGFSVPDMESEWPESPISSPLINNRFRYFNPSISLSPSAEHKAMTAQQVYDEVIRVHKETIRIFKEQNKDLASVVPNSDWPEFTYEEALKYQVFHIAYHTGQIYSARHLLGEETVDN